MLIYDAPKFEDKYIYRYDGLLKVLASAAKSLITTNKFVENSLDDRID